jgi:hypothetical protein
MYGEVCSCTRWGSSVAHQEKVNKQAMHSWHLDWLAVDLVPDNLDGLPSMARYAMECGFTGVEIDLRNGHLHLDMRTTGAWYVVVYADGTADSLVTYLSKNT